MKRITREIAAVLAACACGLLATACGNSEPPSNKARANAPLQPAKGTLDGPAASAAADDALKERLARQEAATKLFDKSKAEPAPAKAATPAPAPEPVKTAAAVPAKAEPAKPAPEPAKPAPEPVKAPEPAAPPKVEVAAAKAAAPQPAAPALAPAKLVSKVDPDFPREAVTAGAEKGSVKARMTLDGNGNVTRVDIVDAKPRRVFDNAVTLALAQWKFNDGATGRIYDTEVLFQR